MIGLSKSTGYAILTLSCLAASGGRRVFAKEIARCTGVPGAYLSKILRLLSQAGLIEAKRGYRGGVSLVLDPKHITLPAGAGRVLKDASDRPIRYLRLSLTSACQMKCVYCRPAWLRNTRDAAALSPADLERVVRHMVRAHGVRKVRLTGGDPTARPDLTEIIERLAGIDGLDDLAMTTNGLALASRATAFVRAGLRRVNISLDTLDRDRFQAMTGEDGTGICLVS